MISFNTSIIANNSISHILFQSINRKIVVIAWHLHEFDLTNYSLLKTISWEIIQTMIILVNINSRSTKSSTNKKTKKTLTKFVEYFSKWITNIIIFRTIAFHFFVATKKFRQTFAYQSFLFKTKSFAFDNNSIFNNSSIISIILKRKTIVFQVIVSRIKSRFRYENDILVIERNQIHVKIFRVFNYFLIIDSNHRFIIDNQ